jgi:hypothetical protein
MVSLLIDGPRNTKQPTGVLPLSRFAMEGRLLTLLVKLKGGRVTVPLNRFTTTISLISLLNWAMCKQTPEGSEHPLGRPILEQTEDAGRPHGWPLNTVVPSQLGLGQILCAS